MLFVSSSTTSDAHHDAGERGLTRAGPYSTSRYHLSSEVQLKTALQNQIGVADI